MKDHAAIVLCSEDKVLFVQRSATKKSLPNIWAFPSGTVEEGETPEITVAREAKEELQVDVDVEKTLAKVELPELGVRLYFITCKQNSDDAIVYDPAEIQEIKWMTFDDFFSEYSDEQIGHGLIYLRKNPHIWQDFQ